MSIFVDRFKDGKTLLNRTDLNEMLDKIQNIDYTVNDLTNVDKDLINTGELKIFRNSSEGITGNLQTYIIPKSGRYHIKAAGASGVSNISNGKGATLEADFALQQHDELIILIGQKGGNIASTGGGATFIFKKISNITDSRYQFTKNDEHFEVLMVAAGGGDNPGRAKDENCYSPSNYIEYSTYTWTSGNCYSFNGYGGSIKHFIENDAVGGKYGNDLGGYGGGGVALDGMSNGGGWTTDTETGSTSWCLGANIKGTDENSQGHGYCEIYPSEIIITNGVNSNFFDKVIQTQEEFDSLIADPTWFGAESVAFIGTFSLIAYNGIKIPQTVKQIQGFNDAKITIIHYKYNEVTAKGALWYDSLPTEDGTIDSNILPGYSIKDLTVVCSTSFGSIGGYCFYNCVQLINCSGVDSYGFAYCVQLTNCIGHVFALCAQLANCTGGGFLSCKKLTNCMGINTSDEAGIFGTFLVCSQLKNCTAISKAGGEIYGFYLCEQLTNCNGTGISTKRSSLINSSGIGFYRCNQLTNCIGTGSGIHDGFGFYNCNYLNGCKSGMIPPTTTDIWGGTNLWRDDYSCQLTISDNGIRPTVK